MAEHGPTGPPWKRLTQEQLNGAQFALRYLRTSVTVKGEALTNLDMLLSEIDEERKSRKQTERSPIQRTHPCWGKYRASDPVCKECFAGVDCYHFKRGDL